MNVGNAAPFRDLRGLRIDVLCVEAAGEAHDGGEVQRLPFLQPIDPYRPFSSAANSSAGFSAAGSVAATASRKKWVSRRAGITTVCPSRVSSEGIAPALRISR